MAGSDKTALKGQPQRKIIRKMLTLKRLTTVWKYATALPEDQTAATLSNCFSTYLNSRNIALQATRVKGAVLKKKINELTVLRVVNLYQPQTRSMGGPFMLVNNSISRRDPGSTRRTSQNSSFVSSLLIQNYHYITGEV